MTDTNLSSEARLREALDALKAWEHWYNVDSTEFNRDTAREMGLKALGKKSAPLSGEAVRKLIDDRYNVIGCAGGEHCVCTDGWGHKKYNAQTPIPVPLAEKSKEELVRIVEMMQEDLRWYVDERNRLLAATPAPATPSLEEK